MSDSSDWTDRRTSWYIDMSHTMYGVSENWLEYWTRTLSYHLIISIYPQLWIQTKINFVMYTSLDNIHCFHFKTLQWPVRKQFGHHPQVTAPQCHNCFIRLTYFLKSIKAWKSHYSTNEYFKSEYHKVYFQRNMTDFTN